MAKNNPTSASERFWNIESIILMLICVILYANTLGNGYAVDDKFVLLENKLTQKGFSGIPALLTTDSFQGFLGTSENKLAGGRYRPLALVTFAIEYSLWKENPAASHAVNLILYAGIILALFRFLTSALPPDKRMLAFAAAALFALHPIHTEAVANIKGRDELLSLLFTLLALINVVRYARTDRLNYLFYGLGTYFLALLSKENGLMLLGLAPLTLYFFSDANRNKIFRLSAYFGGVALFYIFLRITLTGLSLSDDMEEAMNNSYLYATPVQRYATVFFVLLIYLKLLFVPYPLSWDYSYSQIEYRNFSDLEVWAAILTYTALLGFAIWGLRKKEILAFGIWFYLISLFIVSGLVVNIGGVFLGERFLFQPSIGFAIVGATFLYWLGDKIARKKELIFGGIALVALPAGGWTIARNFQWENNETLYLADVKSTPKSARANQGAAAVLLTRSDKGTDPQKKEADFKLALAYLDSALKIYPRFVDAYVNLAGAYYVHKDYEIAEKYLSIADSISPLNQAVYDLRNAVAIGYYNRGVDSTKIKNYAGAAPWLAKAISLSPKKDNFYYTQAIVYANLNDIESAKQSFKKALALAPNNAQYWYDLGGASFTTGDWAGAIDAWQNCLKLDPNNRNARNGLMAAQAKAQK